MTDAGTPTTRSNPLAVTAVALGILGLVGQLFWWALVPGVVALLAAALGFIARRKASAGASGAALAAWGLSLGLLAILVNIVLIILDPGAT